MSGHANEVESVDVTRQATGGLAAAIYERRRPRGFIYLVIAVTRHVAWNYAASLAHPLLLLLLLLPLLSQPSRLN